MTTDRRLRWPAEFEPHAGTALTWPHNPATWHRGLEAPRRALASAVTTLARDEHVHIHFSHDADISAARDLIVAEPDDWTPHLVPSNDAWCRDHGAIIVRDQHGMRLALDFGYNAWGGKYPPWDLDAKIAGHMAEYLGLALAAQDIVLEGGAIEGNGQGVVMSTASCVLHANRNAGMTSKRIEHVFAATLGAHHVMWLSGEIPGDDTDAHIDNLARFVSTACALVVAPDQPDSDWAHDLAGNPHRLEHQCAAHSVAMDIRTLPLPQDFISRSDLPASYANFYIGQGSVLMPVYGDRHDDTACAIVADCFPTRELIPIDCTDLIVGLGALHCLTQQIPE